MKLAIIVPCYNEEEVLPETTEQLTRVLANLKSRGSIDDGLVLYVDDGSRDRTWELIEAYSAEKQDVAGVKLAHNAGHQQALWAGLEWAAANADALLTAYYPGQEGGTAVADVLFGDYNPAGRLPISVAANVGQLPVYYNKRAPKPHNYVEMSAAPLYAFGYGLSYTQFAYSNLAIAKKGDAYSVTFDVKNVGERDGEEVAQLYIHDQVASVSQPLLQLKKFDRLSIAKGETRKVEFILTAEDLAIIDRNMKSVVEPGDFDIMVGGSSDNLPLRGVLTVE